MLSWSKCVSEIPPLPPPSSATTPGTPSASRTDGLGYRPCSTATSSVSRRSSCEARTHLRVEEQRSREEKMNLIMLRPWVVNSIVWFLPCSLDLAQLLGGCYHKANGKG